MLLVHVRKKKKQRRAVWQAPKKKHKEQKDVAHAIRLHLVPEFHHSLLNIHIHITCIYVYIYICDINCMFKTWCDRFNCIIYVYIIEYVLWIGGSLLYNKTACARQKEKHSPLTSSSL